MASLTVTPYEVVNNTQANPLCFDGTKLWMGLHSSSDLDVQTQDPVSGAILNTYTIGVSTSSNYRPIPLPFAGSIWFGSGSIFIDPTVNVLYQVDLSGTLTGTFNITGQSDINANGISCVGMATDGTLVYTLCTYTDTSSNQVSTLTALDSTGTIAWSLKLTFGQVAGPVFDGTDIWIATVNAGTLVRYDNTGAVVNTVTLPAAAPAGLAFANADIWAVDGNNDALWQVVASTGAIVGSSPLGGGHDFPYYVQSDAANNLWIIAQDLSNDYHILVFDSSRTQLVDYTFAGSGASPSFAITNSLAFAAPRMFATGVTAVSGNPVLWGMLLTLSPAGGAFQGSFAGFFKPGVFGGGTK